MFKNEILLGNSEYVLKEIESNSIDLVLTSPPYYQQRNYTVDEREIGGETYVYQYVQSLCSVFCECLRVLKEDGNIVFNLGDKYINGSLRLIPYHFAINVLHLFKIQLINDITWVKSNPTPSPNKRKLVNATESFFHFVKNKNYYYDIDNFLFSESKKEYDQRSDSKGIKYFEQIESSQLSDEEKKAAKIALKNVKEKYFDNEISDFRMKIRGVHKKAYGGNKGGRNNQIDKNGFTVIEMKGGKMKKDVIMSSVDSSRETNHPATFPIKMIKELIILLSPEKGIVLDPFCGSGTTCLAAKELNRDYIGIDISKDFCDISKKRLEK